jgi:alpha-amylase/alpha-mannosidase (GH57 family)
VAPQIVVHGHFYQPPRENPWTGVIDDQPGAAPFSNWNELVHAECYKPNAFVTLDLPDETRVVNNFEKISFDVGPTLLSWLEEEQPETYGRIIAADKASLAASGHGNAIAQAYHHTILPLSPLRDVRTEVRWGLEDFRHRFDRDPEGMWLPEAAASDAVLGVLIDAGVRFTILAPWQAANWRGPDGRWVDARSQPVDTRVPYRYLHPEGSGRELIIFFYDADIARQIAFEQALTSAEKFVALLASRGGPLVHAATDGETYGHHHKFSEVGLALALFVEAERNSLQVTNYGAALDQIPVEREVLIAPGKGTSWSCAHGVGRWERDCGCWTGGQPDWDQKWRAPLRAALEVVRDAADDAYGRLGHLVLADPWGARDRYIDVLTGRMSFEEFVRREAAGQAGEGAGGRIRDLLEMQRMAMAMFTSCGWFFNDISGIETVQVLRYAARALDFLKILEQPFPLEAFLAILGGARSNLLDRGTGADIFASIKRPVG